MLTAPVSALRGRKLEKWPPILQTVGTFLRANDSN